MTHPIVHCARSWIGTRFHHQGRLKKDNIHKGGVDCLGLLIGVADELGLRSKHGVLLSSLDEVGYSHQPDRVYLRDSLEAALEVISTDMLLPGDVLLLKVDGSAQHLGILSYQSQGFGLIHAYAPARAVIEHSLDRWWQASIETGFRVSI